MLIGALEAGGTKMVCSIGNPQGGVLQRASFPTLTPDVTVPQIVDFIGKFDVKALGIGISYPLHTAVFALDGETVTAHPDGWQFRQFRLESGHVVSCCVSPGDTLPAFPEHIAI